MRGTRLHFYRSTEEIILIFGFQRLKVILGASAAIQGLAVAPELKVIKAYGYASVAIGVEGIQVDGGADIASGIDAGQIPTACGR